MADKETQGGAAPYIAEALRPLAIPIESVKPDPANARRHPDRNLDAIVASLSRFGQRSPIVVQRQGMVVRAGNGRLEAAKRLGWKHIAAVIVDESSTDATAFAIADNRTSDLAEWDDETLASLLQSLPDDAREAAGYDEKELSELLNTLSPEIVEDEAPEPLPDPVSKTGDVWIMGGHRLLCGDSTKAGDVGVALAGDRADMLLTDPPYNVALGMDETPQEAKARNRRTDGLVVANDKMPDADFRAMLVSALRCAFDAMKPGASFYIWHADSEGYNFRGAVIDCGERVRQCLIWNKSSLVMGRQDYQWKHEPCLYGWKDGAAHGWYSDRTQPTVIECKKPSDSAMHPTMKPLELFAYLVGNSTTPQGVVYEPFSGSGTTIIACEQLGRKCYAIEIEPRYVDVAVRRWQKLTGKDAVLESSGKTWRETATERGVTINE